MKKIVGALALVIVSSWLFSACGTSQKKTPALESQTDNYNQLLNQNSNQNLPSNTAPPEEIMSELKKLEDFKQIEATQATLHTTKGDITFELYREQTPITTANFLDLADQGYYDGIVFHRVIEDFMAQVGDPQTKDESLKQLWGTGGPGYNIPDEFDPELKHDSQGILSMANTGRPNSGGSQFFLTHGPTPHLDGKHTVFGKVIAGLDILMQIEVGDKINSVSFK